jgi:hypothetical protein
MKDWTEEQMPGGKERGEIDRAMRWLWLMWLGLIAMLGAFVVFANVPGTLMRERMVTGENSNRGMLQIVFGIFSIVVLGIARYLRKSCVSGKHVPFRKVCAQLAAAGKERALMKEYRGAIYITMAMASSPGVCGFVLGVSGAGYKEFYAFVIIAVAGLIWLRPKRSELISMCQRHKAGTLDFSD